jgi:DNA processing protein
VSGLARGIDAEAHAAALAQGGSTVAVLGSGLARVYPPEHGDLARRITRSGQGALLTEFPISSTPRDFHFPMRNRILSGLSEAVLVVEAGEKSGSLITVRHALDQGKGVYVVPGRIGPEAMGCLRLLSEGAAVALEPDDILPSVHPGFLPAAAGPAGPSCGTREDEGRAGAAPSPMRFELGALFAEEDAWHPDAIAERLEIPLSELLAELSRLELDGTLRRLPGGRYARTR